MSFRLPTRVIVRPGCLARLSELVEQQPRGPALLVSDEGLRRTPWPEKARALLAGAGREVRIFDQVEPNPRHTTVNRRAAQAREEGIALVVGLGGGSALDAAKAIAMLVPNQGSIETYEGRDRYERRPLPFLAIPTTCGTGSEVTWVAVITRAEERRKMSIKGETMFPSAALVDADLLASLPRELVTWTGLDALTHALEAIICRAANPISDALAEKAVALQLRYLRRAAADIANDAEAREALARASTLAGMAFGNADVAGVHCLSESLGGLLDIPHGLANAILLLPLLRYQLEEARGQLARLHGALLGEGQRDPAGALLEEIATLIDDLGLPSFSSLGVSPADHPTLARMAAANNSNPSNPRVLGAEDYRAILAGLS